MYIKYQLKIFQNYVGLVMVLGHLTLQIGKNMECNAIILYLVIRIRTLAGIMALEGGHT